MQFYIQRSSKLKPSLNCSRILWKFRTNPLFSLQSDQNSNISMTSHSNSRETKKKIQIRLTNNSLCKQLNKFLFFRGKIINFTILQVRKSSLSNSIQLMKKLFNRANKHLTNKKLYPIMENNWPTILIGLIYCTCFVNLCLI
jgi:hypothetical protein